MLLVVSQMRFSLRWLSVSVTRLLETSCLAGSALSFKEIALFMISLSLSTSFHIKLAKFLGELACSDCGMSLLM